MSKRPHISDLCTADPVALSADMTAGAWIKLIPSGTFQARDGRGPFDAGDETAMQAIVTRTKDYLGTTDMMIDYDHQTAFGAIPGVGGTAKAAGWVKAFEIRSDGIYGRVEWTAAAKAAIEASEYRYISPLFRGTFQLEFAPRQVPRFRFTMMGLLGTITDTVLPASTLGGFQKPVPVSKANTTFSLHGAERVSESVSFDLGVEITPRFLIGDERMQLVDRQTTGTAVVEAKTMAAGDWFGIATAKTTGALQLVHGTVAGHTIQIDAPAIQIGRPASGQTNRIVNYSLPLMFLPDSGDDEIILTIK
ncbi:MAG: phage tail tube protein [Roseibium sp.]